MKLSHHIREWNHHRIDTTRKLAIAAMKLLLDKPANTIALPFEKIILILRLDNKIGDSITSTGFLRELKKHFADHQIWVLSDLATLSIYQNSQYVDRVLPLSKGPLASLAMYIHLKKHHFKFIINTSHLILPRVIFLVSRLRATRKITFQSAEYKLFTDHIQYNPWTDHITKRYGNTLLALGIQNPDLSYEFPLSTEVIEKAKIERMRLFGEATPLVILNSFAGARLRSFNKKTTTEIVQGLLAKHPSLQILSIGNQHDLPLVKTWCDEFANPRWKVSEHTNFTLNMALLSLADLVITPDTALVHIACAFKRPLVAVFRGDGSEKNSLIWAPYGTEFRMVQTVNDPAYEPDINRVEVPQVLAAASDLLASFAN